MPALAGWGTKAARYALISLNNAEKHCSVTVALKFAVCGLHCDLVTPIAAAAPADALCQNEHYS